jgi:hypothetical protein
MGEMRHSFNILVGELEKRTLGRSGVDMWIILKWVLKE